MNELLQTLRLYTVQYVYIHCRLLNTDVCEFHIAITL